MVAASATIAPTIIITLECVCVSVVIIKGRERKRVINQRGHKETANTCALGLSSPLFGPLVRLFGLFGLSALFGQSA